MENHRLDLTTEEMGIVSEALQAWNQVLRPLAEEDICSPATTRRAREDLQLIENVNSKMANSSS